MLNENTTDLQLLDCTLRDGGYYTNWDFEANLVDEYFKEINQLPIDYVEVGYRSKRSGSYEGAYYYLPDFILNECQEKCNKKLAIILNEKEVEIKDLKSLLEPCKGIISLVRIAVAPINLDRAIKLSKEIKELGFEIGFNLMYASKWESYSLYNNELSRINDVADYFYVVDSFGGLYPFDVEKIFTKIKKYITIPIGFHAHNNLELALINTLTAIKNGAQIVDSTVLGMGRGAGNLKTELILTLLNKQNKLPVNFDALFNLNKSFQDLKEKYNWGINLPYMISGAFSMPQDTVMSKIKKRYYSLNSIIKENVSTKQTANSYPQDFPIFKPSKTYTSILIVGGGKSPLKNKKAHQEFLKQNPDIAIVFVSSKNIQVFSNIANYQFHCLIGKEGQRLEKMISLEELSNKTFIIPQTNTYLESYVPYNIKEYTRIIKKVDFENNLKESATALAFQIGFDLKVEKVYLTGYDGYSENIQKEELELFEENHLIFDYARSKGISLYSLTPTQYNIKSKSIYSLL
ncbi:aldolase catalytic domain-containing protein [Gillisia sp. JM1]|uniref:aldolase catalytic domain-containing protein n=1 Tax=Gillisia sp. JM1 TaxID=1283286 RepID=UPI0003FA1D27|nr:aldolase catalytic domain-containing protein [Gillisia sp. JM1]